MLLALILSQLAIGNPEGPIFSQPSLMGSTAFFEAASSSGRGMPTEAGCYAATAVTGVHAEPLSFARSSVAELYSNDGQSLTQCTANQLRISSGNALTTRPALWKEAQGINSLLHGRDQSNVAWVKTNMTCVRNQPGMRSGDTNGATRCTATSANATVCQTIVVGASTRASSGHIKRAVGTSVIDVARDGATYTAITSRLSSSVWRRVVPWSTPGCAGGNCIIVAGMTSGVANPQICVRIAASGDAVDLDFWQDEAGYRATSPLETTVSAYTRTLETAYYTITASPIRSIRASFISPGYAGQYNAPLFAWQDGSNAMTIWMPNAADVNQNYGCLNLRTSLYQTGGFTYAPTSSESFNSLACDLTDATAMALDERGVINSTATVSTAVPNVTRIYVGGAEPTGYGAPYDMVGVFRDLCADPVAGRCTQTFDSIGSPIAAVGDSLTYGLNQGTSRWVYTLGQALNRPIYNIGFTGNTTAQCLAAYNTSVAGKGYSSVTVLCGINDLIAGVDATTIMATLTTIYDTARAAGLNLTIATIPPWSGAGGWDAAKQTQTLALNTLIAAYGSTNSIDVVDLYNSALRSGTALAAASDSGDGIHWNGTGATIAAGLFEAATP